MVRRGAVVNAVNVTGHVEPALRVALGFAIAGRIERIQAREGAEVAVGETLAVLDTAVLEAQYREARARIAREELVLRELAAGTRSEEVAVSSAAFEKAEDAEASASRTLEAEIADAFVAADGAVRDHIDQFFDDPDTNPSFGVDYRSGTTHYVIRADNTERIALAEGRKEAGRILASWESGANIYERANQALSDLATLDSFFTKVAAVVTTYQPNDSDEHVIYDAFQAAVASARSAVTTARSSLIAAFSSYEAARGALEVARLELERARAGLRTETRAVQEAAIVASTRSAEVLRTQIDYGYLVAPVAGTVASVPKVAGELVTPGEDVVVLHRNGAKELVAYVPEADIAAIVPGAHARVTFDAFTNEVSVNAVVRTIADVEDVREGVPTYKVTLDLEGLPASYVLRSGMTADINILVEERPDTLFVPTRSILRDNGRRYVRVVTDEGELAERDVSVGLRGSEGTTEIVSGLSEGERIVLFIEE